MNIAMYIDAKDALRAGTDHSGWTVVNIASHEIPEGHREYLVPWEPKLANIRADLAVAQRWHFERTSDDCHGTPVALGEEHGRQIKCAGPTEPTPTALLGHLDEVHDAVEGMRDNARNDLEGRLEKVRDVIAARETHTSTGQIVVKRREDGEIVEDYGSPRVVEHYTIHRPAWPWIGRGPTSAEQQLVDSDESTKWQNELDQQNKAARAEALARAKTRLVENERIAKERADAEAAKMQAKTEQLDEFLRGHCPGIEYARWQEGYMTMREAIDLWQAAEAKPIEDAGFQVYLRPESLFDDADISSDGDYGCRHEMGSVDTDWLEKMSSEWYQQYRKLKYKLPVGAKCESVRLTTECEHCAFRLRRTCFAVTYVRENLRFEAWVTVA